MQKNKYFCIHCESVQKSTAVPGRYSLLRVRGVRAASSKRAEDNPATLAPAY